MPIRLRFWETPSYRLRLWAIGMLTFACVAFIVLHIALNEDSRQKTPRFWAPLISNPLREQLPGWLLAECESFKVAHRGARMPHARRICEYFSTHATALANRDASQVVDLLGEPDSWDLSADQRHIAYQCDTARPIGQLVIEWRAGNISSITIRVSE